MISAGSGSSYSWNSFVRALRGGKRINPRDRKHRFTAAPSEALEIRVLLSANSALELVPTMRFEAESPTDAFHENGRANADGWSGNVALDDAGYLVYGPYTDAFADGWHTATFILMVDNNTADNLAVARIEVYDAATGKVLREARITRQQFNAVATYQEFNLSFYANDDANLEFRTFWLDTSFVQQDAVEVNPASTFEATFEAETDLAHIIGKAAGDGWSASTANDSSGFLTYGPYTTGLTAGVYRAAYRLMVDNNTFDDSAVVTIDVVSDFGQTVLAQRTITRGEFKQAGVYQDFTLDFASTSGANLEFRTFWHGTSFVNQDSVKLTAVPASMDKLYHADTKLFNEVGRADAGGWSANVAQDDAGLLIYGPSTSALIEGSHVALFRMLVDNVTADDLPVVTIEFATSGPVTPQRTQRTITRSEFDTAFEYQTFALPFVNVAGQLLDFRVYWHDVSYLRFENVSSFSLPISQYVYEAEDSAYHQIGRKEAPWSNGWSANVVDDDPGYLMFGPYTSNIKAGPQTAEFRLQVDNTNANNDAVVRLDVFDAATNTVLAQRIITRKEFDDRWVYQSFELSFDAPSKGVLEFRTYWEGTSYVQLDSVMVFPSGLTDDRIAQVFDEIGNFMVS